ncbi:MAG: hypothetical protein OQK12_05375 [Motiliproteus sp.]|nr:hypothetical protein [Motiliproteus sp.]MCW9053831.1 hypothetical protein [Motiliproteus sp.]
MRQMVFTGIADDDRRIARELQAMGAYDQPFEEGPSVLAKFLEPVTNFITWMRWKGEVNVYGCRVAAQQARIEEGLTVA